MLTLPHVAPEVTEPVGPTRMTSLTPAASTACWRVVYLPPSTTRCVLVPNIPDVAAYEAETAFKTYEAVRAVVAEVAEVAEAAESAYTA
jgi:hypothetical protein